MSQITELFTLPATCPQRFIRFKFTLRTLLLVSVLALLFSSFTRPRSALQHTLQDALNEDLVTAEFISRGGSSQLCVDLHLRNLTNAPVHVVVQPGTYLIHDAAQDILVTREEVLVLSPSGRMQSTLYGFCSQPHEGTPQEGDRFTLGVKNNVSDGLATLAGLLAQRNLSAAQEQSVIWAGTPDFPIGGLQINRERHPDVVQAIEHIRGEAVPTYVLDYGELLDRPFRAQLNEVRGVLHYAAERNHSASSLIVYAPDGEPITTLFDDEPLEAGTRYRFRFSLKGTQVGKGMYTMVLSADEQVLHTTEINL